MCWLAIIFFSTTVNSVPGAWQSSEGSSAWITNAPNSPQIKGMEVPLPSPTTTPCASTDKRSCRLIWRGMKMGIFGSVGSAFCSPPSAEQGFSALPEVSKDTMSHKSTLQECLCKWHLGSCPNCLVKTAGNKEGNFCV